MDDSEAFGHWLAGFTAGEGTFDLVRCKYPQPRGRYAWYWSPRFRIGLRDDDAAILEECHRRYGGNLQRHKASKTSNTKASITWAITGAKGCMAIVKLFRCHPLRGKKQRDFDIWALAVEHMAETCNGRGRYASGRNHAYLQSLHDALRATRVYAATPLELAVVENPQSRFA